METGVKDKKEIGTEICGTVFMFAEGNISIIFFLFTKRPEQNYAT